jgi:Flp pilus assembly protein TadG
MSFRPSLSSTDPAKVFQRSLRGFARARGGVTAVEFSLVAPIAIALLIGVVDYGLGYYLQMEAQQAAQVGAQYAAMNGFTANAASTDPRSPAAIANAVVNATLFSAVAASPKPYSYCGCASASGIVAEDCGSTCSDGTKAGTYLKVSAVGQYNTLLPYPLIPNSFNLKGKATVRLQ